MPRPRTKDELLTLSLENYKKLIDLIDSYTEEQQSADFPEGTLNRNISDVLAHLHQWHLMFLDWYYVGMKEEKPHMPESNYTWKTLPELNKKIWHDYKDVELNESRKMLDQSFEEVRNIIIRHTNNELFDKKRYRWTGSTSLGAYLVSATSSHYDWAYKLIKKVKKSSPFVT